MEEPQAIEEIKAPPAAGAVTAQQDSEDVADFAAAVEENAGAPLHPFKPDWDEAEILKADVAKGRELLGVDALEKRVAYLEEFLSKLHGHDITSA